MNGAAVSVSIMFALFAGTDWVAVARRAKRVEYVCKPAATVALIVLAWALPEVDDPVGVFYGSDAVLGVDRFVLRGIATSRS